MTVLAKIHIVHTKTEFNFIAAVDRHTQYIWSTFVQGILPTLQSYSWNNGTHGERQLGTGDLNLLPLTMGPLLCHWSLCGCHDCSWGVPNGGFCHLPPHPNLPIPSTSSIINTDSRKGRQKIPSNSAIRDREG